MHVILIHGLASHPSDEGHFQPLKAMLQDEGHQVSSYDWDSIIPAHQFENLDDLVIIGHSLGGWKAFTLTPSMKKVVKLLVLLDPVWKDKWFPWGRRNFYIQGVNKAMCWYRKAAWIEPPFAGKISNPNGENLINYEVKMSHPEIRDSKTIARNIIQAIKEL